MKKLINDPATVVTDALSGIAAAHPELRVDVEHKIIYRATAPASGKVGLISGGLGAWCQVSPRAICVSVWP